MSTPAATSQDSGPMTLGQAAERFEDLFEPKKATKEVAEDAETNAALEGDDDPDPEAEQEDEEEDKPEETDSEDEQVKKPELHTVKVDGKEIQVPLEELVKGYQREADYTRKTMSLAEQRKAAEAEFEAVRGEREQYRQTLGTLQQQIQQTEPKIDWAKLQEENPGEWTRQRLLQIDRQTALQNIEAERQRIAGLQQEEADKGLQARLSEESTKLVAAIPEWKDEKKASAEKAELVKFAATLGFSPEEVANVTDHRAIVMLRRAYQHEQLIAKRAALKPDPVEVPKTAKPGPPATSQISQIQRAQQRLAKTGKVTDAARVIERFL